MKIKYFFIMPIKGYQYISRMLPANCRYYPTCSEYAKWQFEFNSPYKAFIASTNRILRCNQLFIGGIDYPLVDFSPRKASILCKSKANYGKIYIRYWLVPYKNKFLVIKDFDGTKINFTT
jgi:putative membrane protein insertion efficiency factor